MSKRFIDTGIFDDDWFMDLSKDGKLLWLYLITKCNHAGMIKINLKLCKVQTGINDILTVIKELDNRLVTVREQLYFIPKFIVFQYPGFPNSKAKAQQSAIEILKKYSLLDENNLTVTQLLPNSYNKGNDNDYINDNDNDESKEVKIDFEIFWNLYNKKVGSKDNCKKKWDKLFLQIQQSIINILPEYLESITDRQFQPNPETWINQKRWENEIIKAKTNAEFGLVESTLPGPDLYIKK
jgi:hypothetical protein